MMIKRMALLAILLAFTSLSQAAEPIRFVCDKSTYTIYLGVTEGAIVKNEQLLSDLTFSQKSYGDNENAGIFEFNQWGENGGFHVHYVAALNKEKMTGVLSSTTLDADNTPRGPTTQVNCIIKKEN